MKLLGGNAHLAAQPELAAVGKPGGHVHIRRRAVRLVDEPLRADRILRDDAFAVAGGVRQYVGDGLVHAVHYLDRQNVV